MGRDSAAASRKEAEEQTAYFAESARVGTRGELLPTRLQAAWTLSTSSSRPACALSTESITDAVQLGLEVGAIRVAPLFLEGEDRDRGDLA